MLVLTRSSSPSRSLPQDTDDSTPTAASRETFGKRELARRVRPAPPAALLAVEGRVAREEVDVLINRVWREGVVTDASAASRGDGQRRITVCVPGADGAPNADVVVFQDSSERVWARDAFQKRGAKTSGLRRGWAFSGVVSGQWLVRGHAAAVTSERREETFSLASAPSVYASMYADVHPKKTKLEAGSACASPRRPGSRESAGEKARGIAGRDASAFSAPERFAAEKFAAYGHGESSPERGRRLNVKSLSVACRHLLQDAGPAGLQVSTLVREIQRRGLVKLGGRTPSNTVYSRLSQDARFVNVARGAYALADVVQRHAANATAPPRFDGAGVPARRDAPGSPTPDGACPDDGDTGSVRGDGDGDGDTTRLLSDESLEEVVGKGTRGGSARRVSGRRREGYGSGHGAPGDERAAAPPTDPSLRSRRVSAETLADSSAFSVETKFGKDAKSAFDAGAAASVAAASLRAGGDDDGDVELSAELSAGVLMGLRSGKRPVSDRR